MRRSAHTRRPDRPPESSSLATRLAMFAMLCASLLAGIALSAQPSSASPQVSGSADSTGTAVGFSQDAEAGNAVYAASCASCHQPGGIGLEGTFPPLAGNANVADTAYVETVIREGKSGPIDVNGVPYDSAMPAVPGLSDSEIADVSAYVASLAEGGSTDSPDTTEPPAEVVEPGTVVGGEALFSGSSQFENGGGSCSGCHTAGSVGSLGGPGLGPDLTDVADRLGGEAGLSAWLSNPPSPTMTPIFADRPLTPAEIADLSAFLVDAPSQEAPSQSVDWMFLAGVVGMLVLLGVMAIAYRGMRQNYVERLKAKSKVRASGPMMRGRS